MRTTEQKIAYVYRHRRLDTNEIFYVGIGITKNFKRAYNKRGRSKWWDNIVSKTDYNVEIMASSLYLNEAKELEMLLISEYGRADLKRGSLVNLTDGGEATVGWIPTKEWRKSRSEMLKGRVGLVGDKNPMFGKIGELSPLYGKTHSHGMKGEDNPMFGVKWGQDKKDAWSIMHKGKNNINAKLVLNLETGIFYDTIREASEAASVNYNTLKNKLNGSKNNNTNFVTL